MIDEGFTEAVSEIATELMDELSGVLDDNLLAVASNLNGALDDALRALRRSADDIEAYRGVVTSIKSVTLASDAVLGDSAGTVRVEMQESRGAVWVEVRWDAGSGGVTNTVTLPGFWVGRDTRWRVRLEVDE